VLRDLKQLAREKEDLEVDNQRLKIKAGMDELKKNNPKL